MDERAKKLEAVRLAMCEAAGRAGLHLQNDLMVRTLAAAALDEIEPVTRHELTPHLTLRKDHDGWWFLHEGKVCSNAGNGIAEFVIGLLKDRA